MSKSKLKFINAGLEFRTGLVSSNRLEFTMRLKLCEGWFKFSRADRTTELTSVFAQLRRHNKAANQNFTCLANDAVLVLVCGVACFPASSSYRSKSSRDEIKMAILTNILLPPQSGSL
ncbi:hypothetical protein B0H16DRAFT_1454973 [Mycena metata]|uniref:Uncharacterized protein n=1 Tax=Mycena metata TaxID=1033252 RepID=A0AAD7HBP2_9AGAR|nr:hypothetical protein B0H16DRAFT_1476756 [Mycena metata]KAJ7763707.1 hypothetical protein B0H16DRAFT_1454973 [Mycena metata]